MNTRVRHAALLGAVLPGTVLALWFASGHGYWLDAGEFIAAALHLGIAHPPGHPAANLTNNILRFVPIGPVSVRIAWAGAIALAAAAAAIFVLFDKQLRWLGLRSANLRYAITIAGTWWCTASYGVFFQAVRPEVYALQFALSCWILERAVTLEFGGHQDARPLWHLALLGGFALANHHFLALLLVPAILPTVWQVQRRCGWRAIAVATGACALGLTTYLYLPLRAAAAPELNLGSPTSFQAFWWVVTAQAFQKNTGGGVPQPLWERFADVIVQLVHSLHWPAILLAIAGLYLMWRLAVARRLAYLWTALLVLFVVARAWLGFVRSNPDAAGYLAVANLALVAAALTPFALAWQYASERRARATGPVASLTAAVALVAALWHGANVTRQARLDTFAATDIVDDYRRRYLPEKAIIIAYAPQTVFEVWGGEAAELLRPDLTVVPVPFLTYPGMVAELIAKRPALAPLLQSYQQHQQFSLAELENLAAEHPVLIEMDTRILPAMVEVLSPWGLYYQVLPGGATATDIRLALGSQTDAYETIYEALSVQIHEPETRKQLLWMHYMDALYYAAVGRPEAGLLAAERGLELEPLARELKKLRGFLAKQPADEAADITPFLPAP